MDMIFVIVAVDLTLEGIVLGEQRVLSILAMLLHTTVGAGVVRNVVQRAENVMLVVNLGEQGHVSEIIVEGLLQNLATTVLLVVWLWTVAGAIGGHVRQI